jgi:hypothetical protein
MDTVELACEIAAAAMEWDWQSEYNNGHTIIPAPAQAIRPAIEALADAGLLAIRGKPTPLDQLAPGDRIWLDDKWRTVLSARAHCGDVTVAVDQDTGFTAPAALLVRRADK